MSLQPLTDRKENEIEKKIEEVKPPHFISILTPLPGGKSPTKVKEKYDMVIDSELYDKKNVDGEPLSYEVLSKYIKRYIDMDGADKKICIISQDTRLSIPLSETFSNEKIVTVYISNNPYIIPGKNQNNVVYFGIDKTLLADSSIATLETELATCFNIDKIRSIGITKACSTIKNIYLEKKIHLIIDLQIVDQTVAPSVQRLEDQKLFLSKGDITHVIGNIGTISYLSILGFDDSLNDECRKYEKITAEMCKNIIKRVFTEITEKSVNIFTEDSRFLIYRPIKQISEADIGWYIVRFMTIKEREEFLKHLIDNVITIPIPENDFEIEVYVTSTSVQEQNEKSFYTAANMFDYCLFPKEKLSMIFELINTQISDISQ